MEQALWTRENPKGKDPAYERESPRRPFRVLFGPAWSCALLSVLPVVEKPETLRSALRLIDHHLDPCSCVLGSCLRIPNQPVEADPKAI